jgi:excisionase family DNA binding protein
VALLAKLGKYLLSCDHASMTKLTAAAADEILTLDEVAAFLKAGKRTVYRLAQDGAIPGFKLGGTWRFRRSELDLWIAAEIAAKVKKNDPAR